MHVATTIIAFPSSPCAVSGRLGAKGEGFVNVASLDRSPIFFHFEEGLNMLFTALVFFVVILCVSTLRIMHRAEVQRVLQACVEAHEQHMDLLSSQDSTNDTLATADEASVVHPGLRASDDVVSPASDEIVRGGEVVISRDEGAEVFVAQLEAYLVHGWEKLDGTSVRPLEMLRTATEGPRLEAWISESVQDCSSLPAAGSANYEGDVQEKMQNYAIQFLGDALISSDCISRLQLIALEGHSGRILLTLHNLRHTPEWQYGQVFVILTLVTVTLNESIYHPAFEIPLMLLLGLEIGCSMAYEVCPLHQLQSSQSSTKRRIQSGMYCVVVVEAIACWSGGDTLYRTFVYMAVAVLQIEATWRAFLNFCSAVSNASGVIWLFFCAMVVVSTQSLVLLADKYETNDYYTDQQFSDFLRSVTTMYIFLATGSNYADAVNPSLRLPGVWVYGFFFVFCTMVGMFFIFSLLIDMFCSNFLISAAGCFQP